MPGESRDAEHGRAARGVVAGRWLIVAFWIAAVVVCVTQLPTLGGGSGGSIGDIVPAHSPAQLAQQRAIDLFGVPVGSDVAVVQRRPGGLHASDLKRQARAAAAALRNGRTHGAELRGVVPLVNVLSPHWGEQHTTIIDELEIDRSAGTVARTAIGQRYARRVGGRVTGSTPARQDELQRIEDVLPWITLATIAVIALIVATYFRSLVAPLVTLGVAGLAYVVAVRVLAEAGDRLGFAVPREIEPLLVVFLLGLVTDYSVFFLAHARREIRAGADAPEAARRAASGVGPSVLAAGTLVAACSCALLAAQLHFFRAFGPGLAGCALVVTAVALTLVPALLAILGRWLFGAAGTVAAPAQAEPEVVADAGGGRGRPRMAGTRGAIRAGRREARLEGRSAVGPIAARMIASRPAAAALVVLCLAGLGAAAGQAGRAHLGLSFAGGLPASSSVHRAQAAATTGFTGGIVAPTDVVLQAPGIGHATAATRRLAHAIARRPAVAVALGPAVQGAVDAVDRALHPFVSRSGGAARIIVVFDKDPTSATTLAAFRKLRRAMPGLARHAGLPSRTRITYAGETALGADSVAAVSTDFVRVAIVIAALSAILLALFLRALVASLLLLGASALGYLAALGLTTLAIRLLYGDHQVTYYVPIVGAVILIALGSDYNVLVAGRMRIEATHRRSREAIAVAVPQVSRAITLAGVTLAGTFAMLAIAPVRAFRELALLLTIGVLLDTVIVRSVLVPGLIALAGERAWWPGRPRERLSAGALEGRLQARLPADGPAAGPALRATLAVLGERVGAREGRELARRLPPALAGALGNPGRAQDFGADEFVRRVGARPGVPAGEARGTVVAAFAALRDVVPATELDYLRAGLSADYAELLDGTPAAP